MKLNFFFVWMPTLRYPALIMFLWPSSRPRPIPFSFVSLENCQCLQNRLPDQRRILAKKINLVFLNIFCSGKCDRTNDEDEILRWEGYNVSKYLFTFWLGYIPKWAVFESGVPSHIKNVISFSCSSLFPRF